jgi:3-phosphoshikimate 1-carboxyvinyltransferase
MLCLHPNGLYHIDGNEAMRRRPIKELLEPLQSLGAITVTYHQDFGHFPFTITTHGLSGGEIVIDSSKSSQFLSALLLIAPFSSKPLIIKVKEDLVSQPFVQMTLQMMQQFGQMSPTSFDSIFSFSKFAPYHLSSQHYSIEPDFTAASYFLALTLILGGSLTIPNLTSSTLQGDIAFFEILEFLGLEVQKNSQSWTFQSKKIPSTLLQTIDFNFNPFSDTFPTLAIIAPLLKTKTCIRGIAHTRFQESNRISAIANELRKLNQDVIESQKTGSSDGKVRFGTGCVGS